MTFRPGEVGNPEGRPVGSRNKRTTEILNMCKKANHKDSVFALSELVTTTTDESIRVAAANALAPYQHSKWQSSPVPRFIETPLEIATPETIEQATTCIAVITTRMAHGELDFQSGQDLIAAMKTFIDAKAGSELEARVALLESQRSQPPEPDPTAATDPEPNSTRDPATHLRF
jgi:hypothetical protein